MRFRKPDIIIELFDLLWNYSFPSNLRPSPPNTSFYAFRKNCETACFT